ncbi:g2 mitotic-specific cyclin [Ophiostoma piceae UAMH 11346]|uniref:G2 mitotic-specific cyclin n=1 Tax=Ophiostoma piceae (strain UAMH 11346) TaxID=1262450 RepID=S3C2Y6_OPHP1|nr:g2 mitotic-specific cyclin [Ophiostoma piceae UAMH 11346]
MAPTVFTSKTHQRQKSSMALNDAAKRTAFGDLSNTSRIRGDNIILNQKPNVAGNPLKAGIISSAPMPPPLSTAQLAPTAGLAAPAQRSRNSIAPHAEANQSKTYAVAAHKGAFVFSDADVHRDNRAANTYNGLKKSPRHTKSQPCLKNASGLQQKKTLRRTLSRLPVDHNTFQEEAMLPVPGAKQAVDESAYGGAPIKEESADEQLLAVEPVPAMPQPHSSQAPCLGDSLDNLDSLGFVDVNEAPFVDALEEFDHLNLPPLPEDDTEEDIGRLRDEIEAAVIEANEAVNAINSAKAMEEQVPYIVQPQTNYLSDVPAATVASAMSEGEPWDDDADYYDDQAYTTAHSFRSLGDNTTGGLTTVIMPRMTVKIQQELEIARSIVEASLSLEDMDDEIWDISMVAEYGDDIYNYMKELEVKMLPSPHYMDMQTEIQWSMRSVLMEWLIQVHARFNLLPETLFLTVNYIDRFLSAKIVSVAKLQLVGATAIFIASKYEEIICPSIQEIVYMVDGGYTTDEILKAERFMLSMLNFELGWPGPMSFLRRISKADDYDLDTRTLAKYFLEVTIMDERFVACPPSFLAAGSHCLARLMLRKGDWSTAHTHYSGYTWSQVRPLVCTILQCCRDPTTHHAAVFDKYASNKFKKASSYVEEEVQRGFVVPSLNSVCVPRGVSYPEQYVDCAEQFGQMH